MSETPQPQKEAAFFTSIRSWGLTRGDNGVVGGVVEGLGQRIGMARVPARLLVVLAWILLPGVVMLGYAAAWGLLPDRRGTIIIQNFGRGVTNVGALLGIAVLTLFGVGALNSGPFPLGWGGDPFPWDDISVNGPLEAVGTLMAVGFTLAILGGLAALIFVLVRRSRSAEPPGTGGPHAGGAPTTPPAATPGGAAAPAGPAAPASPTGDGVAGQDPDGATPGESTDPTAAPAPGRDVTDEPATASSPLTAAIPVASAPQPWEPALLPGDARAGVAPSRGAAAGAASAAAWAHAPSGGWPSHETPPTPPHHAPPPPSAAARPAQPRAPRVPGPGKAAWIAFLGVMLVSAAVVFGIGRSGQLAVPAPLAWGACVTIGLGAIMVIVALTGRRLGFLGFLTIPAVLLSVLFASNAGEIRDGFDGRGDWWQGDTVMYGEVSDPEVTAVGPDEPETTPVDLGSALSSDYSTIIAAGACTTPIVAQTWEEVSLWGEDSATVRIGEIAADTDLELTATATRVAFPAGTSIEILGSGETTVIWEDRDVSCYDWSEAALDEWGEPTGADPSTVLRASNADQPVLTLSGRDGAVIYLEEVVQ
ncbi:PspC domain-containing protein [Demequina sp. NBRC 110053]|uniref:PspC domain-containing protein n=1 Tax=Demequina sp. NBRC 110053 TaxID=1570342 RepID=UPI0013565EF9|nr:PspC domain-containing protein [Demequina sp. NBRC 110053]